MQHRAVRRDPETEEGSDGSSAHPLLPGLLAAVAVGAVASAGVLLFSIDPAAGRVDRSTYDAPASAPTPAPATVLAPLAPAAVTAEPRAGALDLGWTAPLVGASGARAEVFELALGPRPVAWERVGATCATDGACSATVAGLRDGEEVRVTLRAVAAGLPGAPASVVATPVGRPGPVRGLRAVVRPRGVTLRWDATRDDGGAAVRRYVVAAGGEARCSTRRTTCTVRDLPRRAARFAVRADNTAAGLPDSGLGPAARTRPVTSRR